MADGVLLVSAGNGPELRALAAALGRDRLEVTEVANAGAALEALPGEPAVVIIDATGPAAFDGVRQLVTDPSRGRFPLFVLTGPDDPIARVVALELGADDVASRPWSTREVALRARGLLRRWQARPVTEGALRYGPLTLDGSGANASVDGRALRLSSLEGQFLQVLAARHGARASREEIEVALWGRSPAGERALDTAVKRLRRKLEGTPLRLTTVRGAGFRLDF